MIQTELHRHLDISLRTPTLLQLAQERGLVPLSTSLSRFREELILRKPLRDLSSVLATFTLFQRVLDRPEVLSQVAFEAVEDCYREGTRKVEFRFSPSFIGEAQALSWKDILRSFEEGIARAKHSYPSIQVGLICIASRDYGICQVDETIDFCLENKESFIGFDLAGNEVGFPCRIFENSFKKLKAAQCPITIHAGEATGPENIWEAIEILGAKRVGHGISAIQDQRLVNYLSEKKICLEMCPTSNWITGAVPSIEEHPLPKALRAGIPVCINTDDPGIFGVSILDEIQLCRDKMGMSESEIRSCLNHAKHSSFLKS